MIHHGECLEVLRTMPDNSVDSICTDPPYGISFMAKKWDYDVPSIDVWRECLRVLKPGGHMLVACGTRTQHRMVVPIEDAGFEIRDVVTWLYGQGFPKSLNVSKAIDKEAGATREVVGKYVSPEGTSGSSPGSAWFNEGGLANITAPATDAAREWEGWGTALKPACEFWTLCRKPLSESTVAKNVLRWGTGGLNIDGCRVEAGERRLIERRKLFANSGVFQEGSVSAGETTQGRFPANLILDEEAAQALDAQTGELKGGVAVKRNSCGKNIFSEAKKPTAEDVGYGDSGGASRFFYVAKASKSDRGAGNIHPTCKPTALMAYLCKLITPPGGLVLDPFAGSGSTGVGALKEGFRFAGIEREAEYVEIATRRLAAS